VRLVGYLRRILKNVYITENVVDFKNSLLGKKKKYKNMILLR